MTLGDVITRIRLQCPGFLLVDHVLTSPITYPYPTALVAPVRNQGQPPFVNIPGGYAQDVVTTFGVYIIVERRQNGVADFGQGTLFDALCTSLRAALVNWTPPGAVQPISYAGGEMAPYDQGIVTWRDDYSAIFEMRYP